MLGTRAGGPRTSRCLGSQVDSGSLWTANAPNGCYARASKLVARRGWGGKGSLTSEPLDLGDRQRIKGFPLPTPDRVPEKRQREAPMEGPIGGVSCCVPGPTGSSQPARMCGSRNGVLEMARRQEWDSQAILQQSCWVVELALSALKPSSLASLGGL